MRFIRTTFTLNFLTAAKQAQGTSPLPVPAGRLWASGFSTEKNFIIQRGNDGNALNPPLEENAPP